MKLISRRTIPGMTMRYLGFALCLLACGSLLKAAVPDAPAQPDGDRDWQVALVPQQSHDLIPPPPPAESHASAQADAVEAPVDRFTSDENAVMIIPAAPSPIAEVNGRTYEDVYRSIPYSHTEYLANPGYRHEATMEILFGQLRPTTIHRHYEPQAIVNELPSPYQPYRFSHSELWQYRAPDFRLLNPGCCW